MLKYMILITTLLFSLNTNGANIYFAKVTDIDSHNIITIIKDNKKSKLRLSYLTTPVKGELFHEETNRFIKQHILKKWIRVSEQTTGNTKQVLAAIIRTPKNKMLNVIVASKGYGLPNPADKPPLAILNAIKIAKKNRYGVWSNITKFAKQRTQNEERSHVAFLEEMAKAVTNQPNKNHQPFVGDETTMIYYPIKCAFEKKVKKMKFFATSYSAEDQGYRRNDCPNSKAQTQ